MACRQRCKRPRQHPVVTIHYWFSVRIDIFDGIIYRYQLFGILI